MILDRRSDLTDIRPCGHEITGEMSAAHRIDGKDQTIDNEDPCEEEIPLSPHRESFRARNCGPTGKGAPGAVRIAQHSCRIKGMSQNGRNPMEVAVGGFDGTNREQWLVAVGTISPIERGMSIEDLQAAHNENEDTDDIEPMTQTHRQRMSIAPFRYSDGG